MAIDDSDFIAEAKLPVVMPVTVPRVKTNDGTPTQFLIDWEESSREWYRQNAANTKRALVEVSDTIYDPVTGLTATAKGVDDLSVAVGLDTTGPFAVATKITDLAADVGGMSASGQLKFEVAATPTGAAAAYELKLVAGDYSTGFKVLAVSGIGSAIGFRADQFVFTDSGTMQNVFDYSGGQFVFTGNVAIDGNLLVTGTIGTGKITDSAITTGKVQDDAITRTATAESASDGVGATASIDCNAGDAIVVWVTYRPVTASGGAGSVNGFVRLNGSSTGQKTLNVPSRLISMRTNNDGDAVDQVYEPMNVSGQFIFVAPSTTTHTITATAVFATRVTVVCMAFSK